MPATDLSALLTRFAEAQLHDIRPGEITHSTAHLVLATAFFSGAMIHLAKARGQPKAAYLPVLQRFLSLTFGLNDEHAAGMVASNARLYKRYTLVEKVYRQGWTAAEQWGEDATQGGGALQGILQHHHSINMSMLDIEGIKEQPEAVAATEPVTGAGATTAPRRRRGVLAALAGLLLLALSTIAYYWYFRQ